MKKCRVFDSAFFYLKKSFLGKVFYDKKVFLINEFRDIKKYFLKINFATKNFDKNIFCDINF